MDIHVYVHEPRNVFKHLAIGFGMLYFGFKFINACSKIANKLDEEKGTKE